MRKSMVFFCLLALGILINGLSIRGETRLPENGQMQTQGSKDQIFVAHEDDDLLFMNPDLMTRIRNGARVQTIYVTAGDKDKGPDYWMSREAGVKEAYAYMADVPNIWRRGALKIENKKIVKFTLKDAPRINLIFLRLPDGIDDRNGEVKMYLDGDLEDALGRSESGGLYQGYDEFIYPWGTDFDNPEVNR